MSTQTTDQPRSKSSDDYLKMIASLQERALEAGEDPPRVSTSELSDKLKVTPGSVSGYLRKLEGEGLVKRSPYRGVWLTEQGWRRALALQRAHRMWETVLARYFDVPVWELDAMAEQLEHALAPEQLERLVDHLTENGRVEVERDPHGDPIPGPAAEQMQPDPSVRLAALEPGEQGIFVRVSDSDPELLRWLLSADKLNLRLGPDGSRLTVVGRDPYEGNLIVEVEQDGGSREVRIGNDAAERLRVLPLAAGGGLDG